MGLTSIHFCTSESWGGLELYACTLMVALKDAGVDIVAVCRHDSKVEKYLSSNGIRCEHLPSRHSLSIPSVWKVKRLIDQVRADVVHVHFHSDIWAASIALRWDKRRKLFLSIYMGVSKKTDILHRWIYSRVDAIFTSSKELNERLSMLYPVTSYKIYFLPYGRHLPSYKVDESKRNFIRSQLNVHPDEILVGTMVRIDPGKGVMDFARSFLYLGKEIQKRVKYLIVGEPTRKARSKPGESPYELHCEAYRNQLEAFIHEHHLDGKIFLMGFQDDVVGYLNAMDVFVFPSRDELYSLVMLDAMCMGLPIVAAKAGGNLQQIQDGINGLLYEVGNSEDLAEKLNRYLKQVGLQRQHGFAARQFVERNHDMQNTIDQLINQYKAKQNSQYSQDR